jgi:hypothetical protein
VRHFRFSAQRLINAPAPVVYHCLADYREHHRPGGILPPAYTRLDVLEGGVGEGTVIRFTVSLAGRATTRTQLVSEPEPGHVLVESGDGEGSTFTVEPRGDRTFVRIDTVLNASGLEGWLLPLFAPRLMRPLYADELARLEHLAQAHAREPQQALA